MYLTIHGVALEGEKKKRTTAGTECKGAIELVNIKHEKHPETAGKNDTYTTWSQKEIFETF